MAQTVNEGASSSIEALFDHFVDLGRHSWPSLLVPWLAIALVDFGFVAVATLAVIAFGTADPTTAGGIVVQVVALLQGLIVFSLRVALLSTLRDVAFEGAAAVRDWGGVAADVMERFVPSLLITVVMSIIIGIGFALCVLPGLVALFFLAFAPYLVAARGEGILDALRRSAQWAAREWALLLSAIVVAVLVGGLMGCVMGLLSGLFGRDILAVPVGLGGGWFVNTILGYLAFLWWGAVYVTAETREHVDRFHETKPRGDETRPLRAHPDDVGADRSPEGREERPHPGKTSIYRVSDDDAGTSEDSSGDQGSSPEEW